MTHRKEAFDWLEQNTSCELRYGHGEEDEEEDNNYMWRVYRRHGGRNDRELHLVGCGTTPIEAILHAKRTDFENHHPDQR